MRLSPSTASDSRCVTVASVLRIKGNAVYATTPDTTVFEAITELARRNIGALVVLEHGRLVGIFSERDYTRNIALKGRASKYTPVFDVMSEDIVTVTPGTTLTECMEAMTKRRIRHLPVLQDERLIGLVSIGDLVNYIIREQREAIEQLEGYITGTYPR